MPEPGVLLFCVLCNGYSHLPFPLKKDVDGKPVIGEWRWHCRTNGGCNSGRQLAGHSRENALYAGSRHSRMHPLHEVWLIDPEGRVAERWGGSIYDAGTPLWVNGIAVWKQPDAEAKERYGMDRDVPPF